jgi:2-amino-4-hydroxy-6-hydroxymethyldihydropteridine diphosphokinase
MPATPTALGLGSNLEDPELQLSAALEHLPPLLDDLRIAPLFLSRPDSPIDQPDYLNTAVVGSCRMSAETLLGELKRIEYLAGRRRGERYGPRVLDIDLLLWGQALLQRPELTLPHPRLREREFVLAPLTRIAADWKVPPDGRTVAQLLVDLDPKSGLEPLEWSHRPLL